MDIISNEIFLRRNEWAGHLAAMASEEMDEVYQIPVGNPRGKYLLMFDPLDGSSKIDVNVSVGSIFSIPCCPKEKSVEGPTPLEAFMQPGLKQVCGGYVEQAGGLRPRAASASWNCSRPTFTSAFQWCSAPGTKSSSSRAITPKKKTST